ncbi:cation:proton antiporter [Corynebacterium lowii]|uniref:Putative monovalent cation/H+ antiporter subunit F n=1 Tax=Corynebacterium lowii TaxID=1544413 RepID=A0A0N8W0N6_9CORY|nr:cation:proton antiporter [Corynebacterium lowii]KQB87202.1 putative monovalent cation/H+ antiporter subunit F [Corynebacterium lowii]MDP9852211.1 multicomponent Na+:H+ antiporter subunit F [Corynebacterium lowii]
MFQTILWGAGAIIAACLLAGLVLILSTRDVLTRVVLSDLAFYAMIALYLVWSLDNQTSINYEIALLAALVGGVLPTLSMSRMVSRGRR